jgi:hypothetical protein
MHELEVGDRVQKLHLSLLWRFTRHGSEGAIEEGRDTMLRGDITLRERRWRLRLRSEMRSNPGRDARLLSLRGGREGEVAWEVRSDLYSASSGGGPKSESGSGPWIYRRRAGGLYGWDRIQDGTWLGAWLRVPVLGQGLEVSADAGRAGWDLTAALQLRFHLP